MVAIMLGIAHLLQRSWPTTLGVAAGLLFVQGIAEVAKLILDRQEKPHGA